MRNLKNINNLINKEERENKKRKIIKGIAEWLIYGAAFALIVWGAPKALAEILNTDYPIASITSSSMWPALKQGDLVFIKGVSGKEDINIGDIAVYANDKGFTIHRVVEKREDSFVAKGDANNIKDSPVEYGNLIGKTINLNGKPLRVPLLGKLSQIIKK